MEDFISNNRILIDIVANGFVVSIPNRIVISDEYEEYMIKSSAKKHKIFSEEAQSDNDLRRLQGVDSLVPVDEKKRFKKLSIADIADTCILVFPTFPEVLKFLENEFKN